jgi:hypothetical protein
MDRDTLSKQLKKVELGFDFNDGYQLLYCPWGTLGSHEIACISINPSLREGHRKRMLSDERGNSYQVEAHQELSPITKQILKLCRRLGKQPDQILMGTICPFRSDNWKDLRKDVKDVGLKIGKEFWGDVLSQKIKLVITLGDPAQKTICELFDADLELEIRANYQNTLLRRYNTETGIEIISLPHLSRFRLFSRWQCDAPLERIFERWNFAKN